LGAGFASEKKFPAPPGGLEKLQADCLVVTNSANSFMLFIVCGCLLEITCKYVQ